MTEMNNEWVICPYCKYQHGDGWEWMKEYPENYKCDGCGKTYSAWAETSVTYFSEPVEPTTE